MAVADPGDHPAGDDLRDGDLVFEGGDRPLRVRGGAPLAAAVALLMPGWPGRATTRASQAEVAAAVSRTGTGFRVASGEPGDDGETFDNAPDAAFPVVNRVLTAMLAQRETRFSLHAAGLVGLAGPDDGAVLLVGDTHAGKSTLALLCAVAGHRILGDDVIVMDIEDEATVSAASPGLAPKMRLPIPPAVAERAEAFLRARRAAEIAGVAYLHPRPGEMAPRGQPYPLRALVYLERLTSGDPNAPPDAAQVLPLARAQAIPALLRNCFAPHLSTTQRLRALAATTASASCHRLRFTDSVAAARLVEGAFGSDAATTRTPE